MQKIIQSSILSFPPRQFRRDPASSYQPTTQSPSFHQPRHTIHFSILSILLILSKTSTHSTQSTRLSSSLSVYFVYSVVQIFASFAFFAARHSQKGAELIDILPLLLSGDDQYFLPRFFRAIGGKACSHETSQHDS